MKLHLLYTMEGSTLLLLACLKLSLSSFIKVCFPLKYIELIFLMFFNDFDMLVQKKLFSCIFKQKILLKSV